MSDDILKAYSKKSKAHELISALNAAEFGFDPYSWYSLRVLQDMYEDWVKEMQEKPHLKERYRKYREIMDRLDSETRSRLLCPYCHKYHGSVICGTWW